MALTDSLPAVIETTQALSDSLGTGAKSAGIWPVLGPISLLVNVLVGIFTLLDRVLLRSKIKVTDAICSFGPSKNDPQKINLRVEAEIIHTNGPITRITEAFWDGVPARMLLPLDRGQGLRLSEGERIRVLARFVRFAERLQFDDDGRLPVKITFKGTRRCKGVIRRSAGGKKPVA